MKNIKYIIVSVLIILGLFSIGKAYAQLGGGGGTIETLDQFTSTTSPSAAITQRTYGKAFRLSGQSAGCGQFSSNGTLTSTGIACGSGGGSGTVNSGTTGQFPYYAANGTTLTATSTLFIDTAGNVGVGTSTPIATLTIQPPIAGRMAFYVATSTGDSVLETDGKTGFTGIGTTTAFAQLSVNPNALGSGIPEFVVGSSTKTHFIVTGSGNTGIGILSPTATLDIGSTAAAEMKFVTTASAGSIQGLFATGLRGTLTFGGGSGSDISITPASGGNTIISPGSTGIATGTPFAQLSVNTIAGSPAFAIGSSTGTQFIVDKVGNVGIGKSSPTSALDVSGGITLSGNLAITGSTANITSPFSALFKLVLGNGQAGFYSGGTNGMLIGTAGDGILTISNQQDATPKTVNLYVPASATLQFGGKDAASPSAMTIAAQNVVAGTSNTAGSNFTITGSQGTGTGVGGDIIFKTAPAGSTGSTQNALSTALTVSGTGFSTTTVVGLNINGQATSTSNVGYNITTGCFAISGTCVGGSGGGSGTVSSGLAGQLAWYASNGTTLTGTSTGQLTVGSLLATSTATSTIANLGGVLDASTFAGSDIYAKAQAAYTWAISNQWKNVTIKIPSGDYKNVTTKFHCDTNGFRCLLIGAPAGGTTIEWTGTATSTIINSGIQGAGIDHTSGCGIANITIVGNSYSTTSSPQIGIEVGGANGSDCTVLENVNVQHLGYGVVTSSNVYHYHWVNGVIRDNGQGILHYAASNSGEGFLYTNPFFVDGANNNAFACFQMADFASVSTHFDGGSFDDCQMKVGLQNIISMDGTHFERPSSAYGKFTPIDIGNSSYGNLVLNGVTFYNGAASSQPDEFIKTGGNVTLSGVTFFKGSGTTVTNAVTQIGSGIVSWKGINNTSGGVTNMISGYAFTPDGSTGSTLLASLNTIGNIGVGTSTPATLLDVYGDISLPYAQSIKTDNRFTTGNTILTTAFISPYDTTSLYTPGNSTGDNTVKITMQNDGRVGISSSTPFATLSVNGAAGLAQFVVGSSTATKLIVDKNGNVGLGTVSPTQQFEVKGTGSSDLTIQNNWLSTTGVWINLSTDGPSGIGTGGAGSNPWIAYSAASNQWFNGAAAGDINYRNANGTKINIGINDGFGTSNPSMTFSGSNVGINNSSPGKTLAVVGTMSVNGLSSATSKDAVCIDASTKEFVDSGNTTCITSSLKTKHDITSLSTSEALRDVMALKPVAFTYNDGGDRRVGFVAEEVNKVDPRLVEYASQDTTFPYASGVIKKGEPISVEYANITAVLVKAVQDIKTNGVTAKRSAEENWQWIVIGLLVLWNGYLTFKRKK